MNFFSKKPSPITIRLVDAATGANVGKVAMPVDQLPDSWETTATIDLGRTFQVLDANPYLKADCIAKTEATLLVRAIVDPSEIKIFMPSKAALIAPIAPGSTKNGVERLNILPDDWRQVEFVSEAYSDITEKYIAEIEKLIEMEAETGSFSRQVERAEFAQPIQPHAHILFEEFTAIFDGGIERDRQLAFFGVPGIVDNGFSFDSPLLTQFYGRTSGGALNVLGFQGIGTHEYDCPEVQALADFAVEKQLFLVDWRRALVMRPESDEFFQFFDDVTGNFEEGAKV